MFLLPMVFLIMVRENPRDYGLTVGRVRLALALLVPYSIFFAAVAVWAGHMKSFQDFYGSSPGNLREQVSVFLTYLTYMWSWEFVCRGFLLLGLKKYVGVYAVYIQLVPFVILHLGKPAFELYGSVFFGLSFGFYAYLVDSFVYGAVVHAFFAYILKVVAGSG